MHYTIHKLNDKSNELDFDKAALEFNEEIEPEPPDQSPTIKILASEWVGNHKPTTSIHQHTPPYDDNSEPKPLLDIKNFLIQNIKMLMVEWELIKIKTVNSQ